MSRPRSNFHLTILSIFLFLLVNGCSAKLSAKLVRIDSSLAPADRLLTSINRDTARFKQTSSSNTVSSTISYAGGAYLMSLAIGTPPMNIVALADTGSDLIWVQCQPCVSCYPQNSPIYDSSKSSTYTSVSCHTRNCSTLLSIVYGKCDPSSFCSYTYEYVDLTKTSGVLSTESFSFGTSLPVPKLLFGCSHYTSNGSFNPNFTGIVGLGGGPLSLVSQLIPYTGYMFSYCLVPFDSNASSSITFGPSVDVAPPTLVTPLLDNSLSISTYYTVRLESVMVASSGKRINVTGPVVRKQEGNIIVDSGTTFTYLNDSVLKSLGDEVSKVVTYPTTQDPKGYFPLCFDISGAKNNTVSLPDLTFQFTGGALVLKPLNMFVQIQENVTCFAVAPSSKLDADGTLDVQVLGYTAQQNFRVEYNIRNQTMSFTSAKCTTM